MNHQKIGGTAALLEAILYCIGIAFMLFVLSPGLEAANSDVEKLSFMLNNKVALQIWHLLIYVVFGIALIPLTIVINEQFNPEHLISSKVTPIFGFIWAGLVIASGMIHNVGIETVERLFATDQAAALSAWQVIGSIQNGLGGGVEVVGGLWVFLISLTGLKELVFTKPLNYLGLLVGGLGILTAIPGLQDLGMVFGLIQIIWFAWIGIFFLKNEPAATAL